MTNQEPVEGCECGCQDTPLDKIRRQVACYEAAETLTPEEQESLATALQVLAVVEQMSKQGHHVNFDEEE